MDRGHVYVLQLGQWIANGLACQETSLTLTAHPRQTIVTFCVYSRPIGGTHNFSHDYERTGEERTTCLEDTDFGSFLTKVLQKHLSFLWPQF